MEQQREGFQRPRWEIAPCYTVALEHGSPSEHTMPSYARTLIYLSMD